MIPVILPKFDMLMEHGTIVRWLRSEGEEVRAGEPICEVMTDKVNMEVEAPASGILTGIRAKPGDVVPVTEVIAYILEPGESPPAGTPAPAEPQTVPATPAARRLAKEAGIDLRTVRGTGPGGRITEADVRSALTHRPSPNRVPLGGRRRAIAERTLQSAREIPHVYLSKTVELSLAAARRGAASYTAVMVWAAARALRGHPRLRTTVEGEELVVHEEIHIGVAVDTPDGLLVPVVREADRKALLALHEEIEALSRRAREGTLTPEEMRGGVFTVSNLGMFGIDHFTSLIVPGQAAVLSVGAVRVQPWAVGDAIALRPVCTLTLALDHRVADGADGARFLAELAAWLERVGE